MSFPYFTRLHCIPFAGREIRVLTGRESYAGLGLQILERQGAIIRSLGGPQALAETERVCRNWRQYNGEHPVDQEDSGI